MATRPAPLDLSAGTRNALLAAGSLLTAVTLYALLRATLGLAPSPEWARASVREVAVVVHIATVVPAIPLGLYMLVARKGGKRHRLLGRVWLALMVATAIASFFIRHMNDSSFSPIHLLSVLTLVGATRVIATARRGDFQAHRRTVTSLFAGSLIVAGLFTFVPGRLFWLWIFG